MDLLYFINTAFVEYILRVVIAMVLGLIIGYDRNRKGSPAGLKTHSLVCVGAALVIITNEYLFNVYGTGDVTRMAAQVVSGIGFLGAGTIIITGKHRIKGLTTAAVIWFCACVGIAVGAGFYLGGIVAVILEVFISSAFYKFGNGPTLEVLISIDETFVLSNYIRTLKQNKVKVITIGNGDKEVIVVNQKYLVLTVEIVSSEFENDFFNISKEVPGVIDIVELN